MSPLYILSSSCISPQPSFTCDELNMTIHETETNRLQCLEPDFTSYINPVQIRRMSRALKIGYTTAIECLNRNPAQIPEAIIIGTGKGCLADTEHFLHSIREYNETALNATHFIHSTYNQLNGMVALNRKISSYNMTYVHRGFSFEHALMDASLLFDEQQVEIALVGSFDEMTPEHYTVKEHWGYWKKEAIHSKELLLSETMGTIAGEGAAFYLLSKQKPSQVTVAIKQVTTLFDPSQEEIMQALDQLLELHSLKHEDIDIVLSGENGDTNYSASYRYFNGFLSDTQTLYFKHLCGEYDTATSFACWLAAQILQTQKVPEYLFHPKEMNANDQRKLRHILIYNNYFNLNQSLILLSLEE